MTSEDNLAGPTDPQKRTTQERDATQGHNAEGHDAAQPAEQAASAQATTPLPGELLAARRQQLNLSIDEVSMRVRLAPRQIIALETNDFASLPGTATTRGFVRSYAKLLGMDPAPLVAMLAQEPNPAFDAVAARQPLPGSGFRPRRYGSTVTHRRGAQRLAGFAAVVLVFVGTVAFIAYRQDWLPSSAPETAPAPAEVPEIGVGEGNGKAEQPQAALPPAAAPASPQMPPQAADGATAQAPAPTAAPAAPVAPPASATSAPAAPAIAASEALELRVREDSWVEVITVRGQRKLLSKVIHAGTTELVPVNEPVTLVVGNAGGVDAVLRGQPLNLAAAARENVVRLNVK